MVCLSVFLFVSEMLVDMPKKKSKSSKENITYQVYQSALFQKLSGAVDANVGLILAFFAVCFPNYSPNIYIIIIKSGRPMFY